MGDSENEEEEGELNIARRTRSHMRIDNFVPNDNLDFPDVDMNLYQNPNSEGDTEYKKFLNQCYSEEIGTDTNNDENDPEYVYNDDIFSHGWRFDLNEVSELHQDESEHGSHKTNSSSAAFLTEGRSQYSLTNLTDVPKGPLKQTRRKIDMFDDPEFARILNQQLRQHIQLLTQTYLLTKNTTNMRNEAEEAKSHLESYMKIFKHKNKPSNLLPAMDLVNNLATPKDLRSSIRLSWRPLPIPEPIKTIIHENPTVFIYPSLLPQVAYSILPEKLIPKKPKINFTINEDKLLAFALNEFKGESTPYAFIASLLMTAKTKTQISNHIKNIKRSPGNENNPIKLYYSNGELPEIDLDSDSHLVEIKQESTLKIETPDMDVDQVQTEPPELEPQPQPEYEPEPGQEQDAKNEEKGQQETEVADRLACDSPNYNQELDDMMNMDLDDLMAASTTISKSTMMNNNNSENNKNIKNLKLKKSMLNLMSHNFLLSSDMGDLIIYEFLKAAQNKLSERNNIHLLQLLTDLMKRETKKEDDQTIVTIYREITKFLDKIGAPQELNERVVLFLDLDQATKCGCSLSYLHWMRFFEFMQHVELYHDGAETLDKKLSRLIDALQKDDPHKVKLAIGNLVNKHPFLKREFESLSLDEKPHPSLFICDEDFDDITEPLSMFEANSDDKTHIYSYEHFNSKVSKEELSYASQTCPCNCHSEATADNQPGQHCGKCNLKFMKGRMYLVNKIKPILAECSYTARLETSSTTPVKVMGAPQVSGTLEWTFEEDREILEFCRSKAEQNEETISFDTSTFEELVNNRQSENMSAPSSCKKNAREIADRFNQLMELYNKDASVAGSGGGGVQ